MGAGPGLASGKGGRVDSRREDRDSPLLYRDQPTRVLRFELLWNPHQVSLHATDLMSQAPQVSALKEHRARGPWGLHPHDLSPEDTVKVYEEDRVSDEVRKAIAALWVS